MGMNCMAESTRTPQTHTLRPLVKLFCLQAEMRPPPFPCSCLPRRSAIPAPANEGRGRRLADVERMRLYACVRAFHGVETFVRRCTP